MYKPGGVSCPVFLRLENITVFPDHPGLASNNAYGYLTGLDTMLRYVI